MYQVVALTLHEHGRDPLQRGASAAHRIDEEPGATDVLADVLLLLLAPGGRAEGG